MMMIIDVECLVFMMTCHYDVIIVFILGNYEVQATDELDIYY